MSCLVVSFIILRLFLSLLTGKFISRENHGVKGNKSGDSRDKLHQLDLDHCDNARDERRQVIFFSKAPLRAWKLLFTNIHWVTFKWIILYWVLARGSTPGWDFPLEIHISSLLKWIFLFYYHWKTSSLHSLPVLLNLHFLVQNVMKLVYTSV